MIRIRTGSRLHFGLLSLPTATASLWLNHEGHATLPRRHFGGVGLMIDRPGIDLTIECADGGSAEGPQAQRALSFARTFCASAHIHETFRLCIASVAAEHAGLGTGTQLGLAVARGIVEATGQPARDAVTLARQVGRGLRSALGVHGFDHGGFLVEGGKLTDDAISPLLVRRDFPDDWHILLVTPDGIDGTHGRREIEAFAQLAGRDGDERTTEALSRIVLFGMLPALMERDLNIFGEAVYDFNRRVGALFKPAQGGLYAHPRVESLVTMLREAGVKGVGQSSWGPTVFAIVHADEAERMRDWLVRERNINPGELMVTQGRNRGVEVGRNNREAVRER